MLSGNCFMYNVVFNGVNFPANGPLLQNKIIGWEPSTEVLNVRDGALVGVVEMNLKLKGGGHYRCHFTTTYKSKKPVELPMYHFIEHRLEILNHDKDYTNFEQKEVAKAHHSCIPTF